MKKVLILSGTASAINYILSLADDPDVDLHVTDANPYCPGLYAPGITPHCLPRARDTEQYRAALERLIEDNKIDVLIPTSDYDVEGVVRYLQDGWNPKVRLFRPPFAAFEVLSHKGRLAAHLRERLPVVVPPTTASVDEARGMTFPVVVKPTGESGAKAVTIVQDPNDLAASVARIERRFGGRFVIQQFIPGRTYVSTLVYDAKCRLEIGVGMRSHVTFFTWGGGGFAGELVDEPELIQVAEEVVRVCGGWRGPINLEWRQHADTGAFYLMEANCRLNGYSYLTTMNGICLPRIVLSLLSGEAAPAFASPSEWRKDFVLGYRETLVDRWVS